jgi:hypothetical protein
VKSESKLHSHVLSACLALSGAALAGPPLTIDDPGILDPGSFEIILAGATERRDSGDTHLLPILDVSYGLSADFQLSAVATRIAVDPEEGSSKSDFGPAALGVKWRFLDRNDLQMSVGPYHEFLLRDGAADREVTEDLDIWVLPVQLQYQLGDWRLNAEIGYSVVRDDTDEWGYGIAVAHPFGERLELMTEFSGGATREFDESATAWLVGFDFAMSDSLHLLGSGGASLHEAGDDDVDLQTYLGLQWFP